MNFDVFLSHNSKDKPVVKEIGKALKERGLSVWLDEWELMPGRSWQEGLEGIIKTVKSAAVLVGPDGMGPWENTEMRAFLNQFVERRLPVIPVLLPDAPMNVELPLFLSSFTWVDFREGLSGEVVDRLVWGITGKMPGKEKVVSRNEFVNLEEVFCTSGLPDYTYIEPSIFHHVGSDIRQPGKHVMITGPSGSGKTCLAFKILEDLGLKDTNEYMYISSLANDGETKTLSALQESMDGDGVKVVIVDDFHVLSLQARHEIGSQLKMLADKAFFRKRVTTFFLVGISTSAEGLLFNVMDLGPRIGIYKMPKPKPADLRGLIEKGEKRIGVKFSNDDLIIQEAGGNFFICQYLCRVICLDARIYRTLESERTISFRISDAKQKLFAELDSKFSTFLLSFLKSAGHTPDSRYPYCAIFASLIRINKSIISLDEIIKVVGEYGLAIKLIKGGINDAIKKCGNTAQFGKYLYFDKDTEAMSIEDPALRYYLNDLDMEPYLEKLAIDSEHAARFLEISKSQKKKALHSVQPESREIFVSYSRDDRFFVQRLQRVLKPILRASRVSLWSDSDIEHGSNWAQEISAAIQRASVAILFVSSSYLASSFIFHGELLQLLDRVKNDGLKIIWIPVKHCFYDATPIAQYQAALDPKYPLATMMDAELDEALVKVGRMVQKAVEE